MKEEDTVLPYVKSCVIIDPMGGKTTVFDVACPQK